MATKANKETKQGMVQVMSSIREQISREIKDMTFEQERAYLDKLLSEKKIVRAKQHGLGASGAGE